MIFRFNYSTDGGTTWQTKDLECNTYEAGIDYETGDENILQVKRKIKRQKYPRVFLRVELSPHNFTKTNDPTLANWLFIQKWAAAPMQTISTATATTDIWGITEFTDPANPIAVVDRNTPTRNVRSLWVKNFVFDLWEDEITTL